MLEAPSSPAQSAASLGTSALARFLAERPLRSAIWKFLSAFALVHEMPGVDTQDWRVAVQLEITFNLKRTRGKIPIDIESLAFRPREEQGD